MVPKKLIDFLNVLQDKKAATKLYKKILELDQSLDQNTPYITKIVYHIDRETNIARLIFTSLVGQQSFDIFSGDIDKFISESHKLEDGSSISVYGIVLNEILNPSEIDLLIKYNEYCQKKSARDEAKKRTKVKYNIGDVLILKPKIRDGSKKVIKKFIVKKIIWSINANPVNILILKQIEGPLNNMSMTKTDCKKYHLKYEENLQVYSMMLNFIKV